MCNFIKKNFIKLLLLLVMTACESNYHPVPRCVPADVLSETKTASVSAYFDQHSEDFISDDKSLGNLVKNDQVVRWKDTGYVTDGRPIILKVDGMWTAWVTNVNDIALGDEESDRYNDILPVERICGPYNRIEKTFVPDGHAECKVSCELISGVKDDLERGAYGPPCWFKNGYGAYLLFKRPDDPEPNETLNHMRYPVSPVMHIGYKPLELAGSDVYSTRDKPIMNSLCQKITLEPGWKIYVKILDKHYYDNVGGYAITFIEGVKTEKQFSVFEWVRKQVRDELDKAGEKLFKHIVGNPVFKNFVFSLLTLFLVFGALAYIFGMVQSPFGDVIVRILKISLIILLISPSSWEFFYNHLLSLFIHGIDQIIAIINSHASSYNPKEPLAFLDDMIVNKIFSPVIWKIKIRALMIADFSSIFAVCVIIIAIFLYVALCMYGFVIYLTAFVGITFLIGLFPLLLLGILFSQFKHLFDGWLTQCISFAMQAILIFTMISLFGALIMNYYYRIFGFTACYNEWLKVKVCLLGKVGCIIDHSVFGWTPGQIYDPKIIGFPLSTDLFMDRKPSGNARYQFTGGGAYIDVPPDRKYKDFRYLDYPFLDPDTNADGNPFGVNVSKDSPFRQLSYYINALLTSKKGYVAARLIKDIEDELNVLEKGKVISAVSKNKVLQIIQDRRSQDKHNNKSELDKYKDEDFKSQVISSVVNDVMEGAVQDPTSQGELNKQYDYNLILRIRAGYLILWTEVGSLFLAALLIWQMRAFIQSVAVSLAGGSMMSQTLASMYEGGFMRIFSEIPVIGVVVKKIDQGIDSFKFVAGNYVTKTARMPLNALQGIPYLGKAVKFTASATNVLTSSYNEHDRNFNNNFKKLNYARAFIGAHLGFSPLDAMKYLGGHIAGKALGNREGGLIHNAIEDRKAALDSLKAHILGPEKYKPSPYIPNKKEEDDDRNPFVKERSHSKDSNTLLDGHGNIRVNEENLKDALEAREQLKTMLGNTRDDSALRNIRYDLDRLDNALRQHLGDKFNNVTQGYADSRGPINHPQDLLPENLSVPRTSSASETSSIIGDTRLDDSLDVVSPVNGERQEISGQGSGDSNIPQHGASLEEGVELQELGTASNRTSGTTDNTGLSSMIQVHNDAEIDNSLDVVSPVSGARQEISGSELGEDVELQDHKSGEVTDYDSDSFPSESASEKSNTMENLHSDQSVDLNAREKSELSSEIEKYDEADLSVLMNHATEQEVKADNFEDAGNLSLDYNVLDIGDLERGLDSANIRSDKVLQQSSVENEEEGGLANKKEEDNSIFKEAKDDEEGLQQSNTEETSALFVELCDISAPEQVDSRKIHGDSMHDSELVEVVSEGSKGLEETGESDSELVGKDSILTQEGSLDQSIGDNTDGKEDDTADHSEEAVSEGSKGLEEASESDGELVNEDSALTQEGSLDQSIGDSTNGKGDDTADHSEETVYEDSKGLEETSESDSEGDYESGDSEFSNDGNVFDVKGLINVATAGEVDVVTQDLQKHVQPDIRSGAILSKKDKNMVPAKGILSDKLNIKDVGIVKERKKESGENKTDNSGQAKSAKTAVNKKSLKKSLKVILNQCTSDLSEKFWSSIDKVFADPKSGKQKRKLSKQSVLSMIMQLETVIASLKDRKRHLTNPDEIKEIEASIKEAESVIKSLLSQR